MKELITVPTFTYDQGDPFAGEGSVEYPIQVLYYNGCISLEQNGHTVNISPDHLDKLFKNIKRNLPDAEYWLKKR